METSKKYSAIFFITAISFTVIGAYVQAACMVIIACLVWGDDK